MLNATRSIQGTTFAWTERYGAQTARDRAIEVGRDVVFALSLAVMVAGAVGFVVNAPSSDHVVRTAEAHRAL